MSRLDGRWCSGLRPHDRPPAQLVHNRHAASMRICPVNSKARHTFVQGDYASIQKLLHRHGRCDTLHNLSSLLKELLSFVMPIKVLLCHLIQLQTAARFCLSC